MSLAFGLTKLTPPDLKSAHQAASAALKLEPEWSYVKDNLLPSIEQQLRAAWCLAAGPTESSR